MSARSIDTWLGGTGRAIAVTQGARHASYDELRERVRALRAALPAVQGRVVGVRAGELATFLAGVLAAIAEGGAALPLEFRRLPPF